MTEILRLRDAPSIFGEVVDRSERYITIEAQVTETFTRSPEAFEPVPAAAVGAPVTPLPFHAEVEGAGLQQGASSGPGSREPGPSVPASGFDPSRDPHDEIGFDIYGRPGRRKLAAAVYYFMAQLRQSYFGEDHGTPAVLDGPTAAMPRNCWFDNESARLLKATTPAPAIEARRAETQGGSVEDESAVDEVEALSPTPSDLIQAAREAAAQIAEEKGASFFVEAIRAGEYDRLPCVQSALRALQSPVRQEEGSRGKANSGGEAPGSMIPEGWVLLPREPTQEMWCAFRGADAGHVLFHQGYRAMLSASPRPSSKEGQGDA